jgi:hypothetical protein
MRQLLSDLSDIGGRTVEATAEFAWDEMIAIHFTDGTSLIVGAKESYQSAELEIYTESPATYNTTAYAALGIISEEEGETITAKAEEENQKRLKHTRRNQYEKLKLEFGD